MVLRTISVIVLVILLVYGAREAWPLLIGPQLSLTIPKNSEIIENGFTTISGTAIHTTGVQVDGGIVLTDQQGHFTTALTLPRGGAILTVTATDRFGRTVTQQRAVFVP